MLNPDGVIVGNYRTSLAARDLNRNYRHPKQSTFPTVWHTKQMIDSFSKDHEVVPIQLLLYRFICIESLTDFTLLRPARPQQKATGVHVWLRAKSHVCWQTE